MIFQIPLSIQNIKRFRELTGIDSAGAIEIMKIYNNKQLHAQLEARVLACSDVESLKKELILVLKALTAEEYHYHTTRTVLTYLEENISAFEIEEI